MLLESLNTKAAPLKPEIKFRTGCDQSSEMGHNPRGCSRCRATKVKKISRRLLLLMKAQKDGLKDSIQSKIGGLLTLDIDPLKRGSEKLRAPRPVLRAA